MRRDFQFPYGSPFNVLGNSEISPFPSFCFVVKIGTFVSVTQTPSRHQRFSKKQTARLHASYLWNECFILFLSHVSFLKSIDHISAKSNWECRHQSIRNNNIPEWKQRRLCDRRCRNWEHSPPTVNNTVYQIYRMIVIRNKNRPCMC